MSNDQNNNINNEKNATDLQSLCAYNVYLQLMSAFVPQANYNETKEVVKNVHDFIKTSPNVELVEKLPSTLKIISQMCELFIIKFPPTKAISVIANDFNLLCKNFPDTYTYGVDYGWLNERMNLNYLKLHFDTPYHYKIGLGVNKGSGSIEENFLLKDAFTIFNKAEHSYKTLESFSAKSEDNRIGFQKGTLDKKTNFQFSSLNYEVAALSRLTVVSFYAFVECFINSVGHDFICRREQTLTEKEIEFLKGFKKGGYLPLKTKMEKFPEIIRDDKISHLVLSDPLQIVEPFKTFFETYEKLRNAAVHYSPLKQSIWLSPFDWINKAREFCELAMNVSLTFWKECYPGSEGPGYLGKLDKALHLKLAVERANEIRLIEKSFE